MNKNKVTSAVSTIMGSPLKRAHRPRGRRTWAPGRPSRVRKGREARRSDPSFVSVQRSSIGFRHSPIAKRLPRSSLDCNVLAAGRLIREVRFLTRRQDCNMHVRHCKLHDSGCDRMWAGPRERSASVRPGKRTCTMDVLLIDDDASLRRTIRIALETMAHRVTEARDGAQ